MIFFYRYRVASSKEAIEP